MNDYGDDDDEGAVQQTKKLAFVLSQLRDDLDEIVSGLESGRLTYSVANDAASIQIRQVLGQLKVGLEE